LCAFLGKATGYTGCRSEFGLTPPIPLLSEAVLLGGENRSGTTLLSVVLDSHPALVVGPELDFTEPRDLGHNILRACEMLAAADPRVLGPGTDTADPFWYDEAHFVKQCQRFGVGLDELAETVAAVQGEIGTDLTRLEDRCFLIDRLGNARRERLGVSRWGIKLQRRIRDIDTYARIWPHARFIHIVRDGRDLAASHLRTVPAWGYKTVRDAAVGWLEVVSRPHVVAPAGRYLEIRYEDLVTYPRHIAKVITDFLDLPFDVALLQHPDYVHSLFDCPWGHPAAEAASQPIHADRIGRYKKDLTNEQIAEFEAIAGPELERLGYA
jgi:Sulfotransferase family